MLDLQTPLEQGMLDAPDQEATDARARVQTTEPLLLRHEFLEAAISYLRNSVRRYGLKKIAKALGRTETSVKIKAKRLGIRKIVTGDGYTMRAVCRGLGVDHHVVERWLVNEWFWGERRESRRHGRQRGDTWYFTPEAIRELVRQHPEEVDLRRVD